MSLTCRTADQPTACQECGATDTELIGITPWSGKPGDPPPYEYFCVDIRACYDRLHAETGVTL